MLRPQMINPVAVQPLLHILREDARSLRSKLVSLKNTFAKSFKAYKADFYQVKRNHTLTIFSEINVYQSPFYSLVF